MPTDRPNVLFVLSDQHNYRFRGDYDGPGAEPVNTPTLDRLAASGTTFERAYCPMPLCTPSRLCMLTGRTVRGAGAWTNGSMLRDELPTVPESFADAGYDTALVGKMHLGGDTQFGGFEDRPYGDLLGGNGHQYEPVSPEDRHGEGYPIEDAGYTEFPESQLQEGNVLRESVAWLREQAHESPEDPWFLCASVSRPHPPYTVPPRHFERYWPDGVTEPRRTGPDGVDEDTMRARAAYFGCVDYLDELLGDLVAMLDAGGFLEDTVVVYTTDHGEMAGEGGAWGKARPRDDAARVPLTVSTPAHRRGDRAAASVETPVSLVDLYPTLCGLAGVDAPADLDGVDLSSAVETGTEPERGPVHVESFHGGDHDYRAVVDGDLKYVHVRDAEDRLYDLAADPTEENDVREDPDYADDAARLRAAAEVDFETVDAERAADRAALADRRLGVDTGSAGNAYLLDDGRLVDADAVVTRPHVLAEDAAGLLADFPGGDDE